jgi:hypothetical protein
MSSAGGKQKTRKRKRVVTAWLPTVHQLDAYFEQLCTTEPPRRNEDAPIDEHLLACRDTGHIEPRLHLKLLQIWACLQYGDAVHVKRAKRISTEFWSVKHAARLKNPLNKHYSQGLLALALFIDLQYREHAVFTAPSGDHLGDRVSFLPDMTASLQATVDADDTCVQGLLAIIEIGHARPAAASQPGDARSRIESAVACIERTAATHTSLAAADRWSCSIMQGERFTDYCNIGFHSAVLLTAATKAQSARLQTALAKVALPTVEQLSSLPDNKACKGKKVGRKQTQKQVCGRSPLFSRYCHNINKQHWLVAIMHLLIPFRTHQASRPQLPSLAAWYTAITDGFNRSEPSAFFVRSVAAAPPESEPSSSPVVIVIDDSDDSGSDDSAGSADEDMRALQKLPHYATVAAIERDVGVRLRMLDDVHVAAVKLSLSTRHLKPHLVYRWVDDAEAAHVRDTKTALFSRPSSESDVLNVALPGARIMYAWSTCDMSGAKYYRSSTAQTNFVLYMTGITTKPRTRNLHFATSNTPDKAGIVALKYMDEQADSPVVYPVAMMELPPKA